MKSHLLDLSNLLDPDRTVTRAEVSYTKLESIATFLRKMRNQNTKK